MGAQLEIRFSSEKRERERENKKMTHHETKLEEGWTAEFIHLPDCSCMLFKIPIVIAAKVGPQH